MPALLTLSISRGSLQQHGQPDLLQKVARVAGCRSIHTHADIDIAIQQSPHWRNAFGAATRVHQVKLLLR